MFDTIFGLPVHPLVVHATVVFVPLAAVSILLAAIWPRFRRWAGFLPLAIGLIGLALVPISTSSGESVEERVGESALVEKHAELGEGLLPWLIVLVVAALVLLWIHRGERRGQDRAPKRLLIVGVAVIALVGAVGTSVQTARIGHSGAEATWSDVTASSSGVELDD